ncbi:hypothetical protein AC579_8011 [Pseudocercospora musae]|uniref:Uncharacterized protein n=1 Tax=Pseudocercospora musae TaxID=113226 RepID=A0A139I0A9_9PEZI|nr:hypothetical protein AC579_8011 [Pseudocercospora musae]
MCKYTLFHFLCGGTKIKVAQPCDQASTNYLGITFCRKDPHPHTDDYKTRPFVAPTFGPGICSNMHCREIWGMIPKGQAEKHLRRDLVEDDTPFDMSPEACQEREDVWARTLLDEEQQMDAYWTKWPLPVRSMTLNAKGWLFPQCFSAAEWWDITQQCSVSAPSIDDIHWKELNPKYLSQRALQYVTALYLPASVTDVRRHETPITTPMKQFFGPFRIGEHTRRPPTGFCKTCGLYQSQHKGKKSTKNFSQEDFEKRLESSSDELKIVGPHYKPLRPDLLSFPIGLENQEMHLDSQDLHFQFHAQAMCGLQIRAIDRSAAALSSDSRVILDEEEVAAALPQLDTTLSGEAGEKLSADSGFDGSFDEALQFEIDRFVADVENGDYDMMDV